MTCFNKYRALFPFHNHFVFYYLFLVQHLFYLYGLNSTKDKNGMLLIKMNDEQDKPWNVFVYEREWLMSTHTMDTIFDPGLLQVHLK